MMYGQPQMMQPNGMPMQMHGMQPGMQFHNGMPMNMAPNSGNPSINSCFIYIKNISFAKM